MKEIRNTDGVMQYAYGTFSVSSTFHQSLLSESQEFYLFIRINCAPAAVSSPVTFTCLICRQNETVIICGSPARVIHVDPRLVVADEKVDNYLHLISNLIKGILD